MNQESGEIKSFTDLDAWKEGHKLVLDIYKTTRKFPKEEQFGEEFNEIAEQTVKVSKITNGLIKKSKSIIHNS